MNMESVAIVMPIYRPVEAEEEKLSIRRLQLLPVECPRFLVRPSGLDWQEPGFEIVEFPSDCFLSTSTYSRLLLSDDFYSRFADFEYILIVQTDALILTSSLDDFVSRSFDYIDAPWFVVEGKDRRLSRVGNGGLSLRRVSAFRAVLGSTRVPAMSLATWTRLTNELPDIKHRSVFFRIKKSLSVLRSAQVGIEAYCASYSLNEDHFWADRARLFDPNFTVAEVEEGLRFAFEENPRECFRLAGGKLPFGCHGWRKHDLSFWEMMFEPLFEGP